MTAHRRRFLRLCGVAGIGAIAGCSGGSEDGGTPTEGEATPAQSPVATLTPTPMATETVTPTETGTPTEQAGGTGEAPKLAADDGDGGDWFGVSMAVSDDGTTALIGANRDEDPNGANELGYGAGSVYVFENAGGSWRQQAKLAADDGDGFDAFGINVALSSDGTTALIGATKDEDPNGRNGGAAYIFDSAGGSWSQQAKISGDGSGDGANFGSSVALSSDGTTAVVGAQTDSNANGDLAGAAYVFDGSDDSWGQQAKLTAGDGDGWDQFGSSVALSDDGTTAIISAKNDEDPNGASNQYSGAGSAYVFDGADGSWTQQAKLAADDGSGEDSFGGKVALSSDGTTALVTDPAKEGPDGNRRAGAAYVFDAGDSWRQQAKLTAADADGQDAFGSGAELASDGTTALIGAAGDEDPNGVATEVYYGPAGAGSAYVFDDIGSSWSQRTKLAAPDGDGGDLFGASVALSSDGTTALVGAQFDEDPNGQDENGNGAGSAYVFTL